MEKILAVLLLSLVSSTAMANAAVFAAISASAAHKHRSTGSVVSNDAAVVQKPFPVVMNNDGYVRAVIAGKSDNDPHMLFCKPGTTKKLVSEGMCKTDAKSKVTFEPVSAQEYLDLKYGRGVTTVVGVSPYAGIDAVIYYRINKR